MFFAVPITSAGVLSPPNSPLTQAGPSSAPHWEWIREQVSHHCEGGRDERFPRQQGRRRGSPYDETNEEERCRANRPKTGG